MAPKLGRREPGCQMMAVPLVGGGAALRAVGVQVAGAEQSLPSGGFIRESVAVLLRDLRHGLLRRLWRMERVVRGCRRAGLVAVAIGDFVPLLYALRAAPARLIFLPTAKSVRSHRYLQVELWLMSRWCENVHPRDEDTHYRMLNAGVPSAFVGNTLMDCLAPGTPIPAPAEGAVRVGLLPGSREEGPRNLALMLQVLIPLGQAMRAQGLRPDFRAALARSVEPERAMAALRQAQDRPGSPGGRPEPRRRAELRERGWQCELGADQDSWIARDDETTVTMHYGSFVEVVGSSRLVFGLAGAANEQAAGLGSPLVTMVGAGPQTSLRRLQEQQRLLLGAPLIVGGTPTQKAQAMLDLLRDEERCQQMAAAGRRAMGPPGAVAALAERILTGSMS